MTVSEERRLVALRNALGGAARIHLRLLAGETVGRDELHATMTRHANLLRDVARPFDAARVDLWLSEATDKPVARDRAKAVFTELGADPYLERAHHTATSIHTPNRLAEHDL